MTRPPGFRAGEILLLAGFAVGAWVAVDLVRPAPPPHPADDLLPHLSIEPIPVGVPSAEGTAAPLDWGDALGPGAAHARAEALLRRATAVLAAMIGIVGGLGYLAAAGITAVSRRFEIRLRRAIGAPRRVLVASITREGFEGAVAAFLVACIVTIPFTASGAGSAALVVFGWTLLSLLVVLSGEFVRRGSLGRKASLGEPATGDIAHPAVPVLQTAAVVTMLISTGVLMSGLDRVLEVDAYEGPHVTEPRLVVEGPAEAMAQFVDTLPRAMPPEANASGTHPPLISVTSPGFWEGVGHIRLAETECGRCWIPGSPPVPAPYRGERAVHHFVSPDTFAMAGLTVIDGRGFTSSDTADSEPVAVVTRRFAEEHFEGGDAVGRRVRIGADRSRWHTVVGIIDALPRASLVSRRQPPEDVLFPIAQLPMTRVEVVSASVVPNPHLLLPEGIAAGLRFREDIGIEGREAATRAWIDGYGNLWRGFGIVGGVLALLGTVAVVGRRVHEERTEIALHRAVGATRGRLVRRYLASGLGIGLVGSAIGAWIALFAVAIVVPEGFGVPGELAPLFLGVCGGLTLACGAVATLTAAWGMRTSRLVDLI